MKLGALEVQSEGCGRGAVKIFCKVLLAQQSPGKSLRESEIF